MFSRKENIYFSIPFFKDKKKRLIKFKKQKKNKMIFLYTPAIEIPLKAANEHDDNDNNDTSSNNGNI
jgi:hypothetical protein